MRHLISLLQRFRSDERGAFLVIFGVLAIVLVAASGAVVDYTSIEQARTRAQVALDAATLGLQPEMSNKTDSALMATAEDILVERLSASGGVEWHTCANLSTPPCADVNAIVANNATGSLYLEALVRVQTPFMSLLGIPNVQARLVSEATRNKLNLEVVLVLDQSNSMNNASRMTNLVAASKCAVNILFSNACNDNSPASVNSNVKVGLVPFTMQVNVGTAFAGASWLDTTGQSDVEDDNFDDDNNDATAFNGPADRLALFDSLNNVTWGGCMEARRSPYDTDDTPPTAATPDTLFVPLFAPDEPSGFHNDYVSDSPANCPQAPTCVHSYVKTKCSSSAYGSWSFNNTSCSGSSSNTYTYTSETGAVSTVASCPSVAFNNTGSYDDDYSSQWVGGKYSNTRTRSWTYPFSQRELQERMCKYDATASGLSTVNAKGPNVDCPANAIVPLTTTKSEVISGINAMASQGGTNIHAGTIWGFHVLSPTEPFTQGGAYESSRSKVMIIMTDGENTAYKSNNMNGSSYFSFYGYPWNQRMGTMSSTDAQLETEMDTRLVTTCTNAKAAGITVYTIGLATSETSDQNKVETMLMNCSSGTGYYYFPQAASELTSVFEDIASQLSKLRLAR